MNVQKAEIKIAVVKDLGRRFAEKVKATETELYRNEGAVGVMHQSIEKIEQHKAFYRDDLSNNKITVEQHKLIMQTIDRCIGILTNLADQANVQKIIKIGELQAYGASNQLVESMHTEERKKLEDALASVEAGLDLSAPPTSAALDDINQRREQKRKKKDNA